MTINDEFSNNANLESAVPVAKTRKLLEHDFAVDGSMPLDLFDTFLRSSFTTRDFFPHETETLAQINESVIKYLEDENNVKGPYYCRTKERNECREKNGAKKKEKIFQIHVIFFLKEDHEKFKDTFVSANAPWTDQAVCATEKNQELVVTWSNNGWKAENALLGRHITKWYRQFQEKNAKTEQKEPINQRSINADYA